MIQKIKQVTEQFKTEGSIELVKPFGSGLINTTYKAETKEADAPNYLLQIINHHVFPNVPELTRNIKRVTAHIRKKLEQEVCYCL